jgi:hypothetical protein
LQKTHASSKLPRKISRYHCETVSILNDSFWDMATSHFVPILDPQEISLPARIYSPSFCHSSPPPTPSNRPSLSLYCPLPLYQHPFHQVRPPPSSLNQHPQSVACQRPAVSSPPKTWSRGPTFIGGRSEGGRRRCSDGVSTKPPPFYELARSCAALSS